MGEVIVSPLRRNFEDGDRFFVKGHTPQESCSDGKEIRTHYLHKEHRERQERLEDSATEARAILSQRRAVLDDVETIAAYAQDMSEFLNESELTERRAFIETFVKEIVVTPGCATPSPCPTIAVKGGEKSGRMVLMFSDSVLPNWSAKMSDHGDINVDAERTGKTSGAQQPAGRAYDYGPGGDSNGSEHTPHQAHPGGLP